jgi:hypothetical protein
LARVDLCWPVGIRGAGTRKRANRPAIASLRND